MGITELKQLLIKWGKDDYVDTEVYTGDHFHTDYCRSTDEYTGESVVKDWSLMDEDEYNNSILANACPSADFEEWYDDKNAKVLVILIEG